MTGQSTSKNNFLFLSLYSPADGYNHCDGAVPAQHIEGPFLYDYVHSINFTMTGQSPHISVTAFIAAKHPFTPFNMIDHSLCNVMVSNSIILLLMSGQSPHISIILDHCGGAVPAQS